MKVYSYSVFFLTEAKVEDQEEGLEARGSGKIEARRYGDLKNLAEVIFTPPGKEKKFSSMNEHI